MSRTFNNPEPGYPLIVEVKHNGNFSRTLCFKFCMKCHDRLGCRIHVVIAALVYRVHVLAYHMWSS